MKFSPFHISFEVLSSNWTRRSLALRYGALPLILSMAVKFAMAEATRFVLTTYPSSAVPDLRASYFQVADSILQLLVFLPLTVAWLRLNATGTMGEASPWKVGQTEFRFLRLQILVIAAWVILIAVAVALSLVVMQAARQGSAALYYAALGWLGISIVASLFALMRTSPVFAAVALDRSISFSEAWTFTKRMAGNLVSVALILSASVVLVVVFVYFTGFGISAAVSAAGLPGAEMVQSAFSVIGAALGQFVFVLNFSGFLGWLAKVLGLASRA